MSGIRLRAENPLAIGVTIFAAAMLIMSGGSQFFLGLAALFGGDVFVRVGGYIFAFDTTVWGWIHLLLGVIFVVVGVFLLLGKSWATWTAIGLVILNGLLNFLWLPIYPLWGVVLIAIDVTIVWALASSNPSSSRA